MITSQWPSAIDSSQRAFPGFPARRARKPVAGERGSRGALAADEERALARRARAGDAAAFDRLVRAHIPLVYTMAGEFRSYGLPFEDLLSEGLLGLVRGAREFDPDRGVRLASYAAFWIRAHLRRFTIENRRIVRGPCTRNARKVLAGLSKTERALYQATGSSPDRETLAQALGVSTRDIEDVRSALTGRDVPCGVVIDGRRFELPSGERTPEAILSDADERRATAELVHGALARLDPRARRILEQRYLADDAATLSALGRELGISRERVRQLETQAMERVRAAIAC